MAEEKKLDSAPDKRDEQEYSNTKKRLEDIRQQVNAKQKEIEEYKKSPEYLEDW